MTKAKKKIFTYNFFFKKKIQRIIAVQEKS